MAWTTAGSRSGMSGYELHDQLSEQFFRPAGGYFANFSSSVGSTSEEIYSKQAVYSYYTLSHPFVERLIGSVRRELLDQTLFWTATDLENKLRDYQCYYNESRTHSGRQGATPIESAGKKVVDINNCRWEMHCRGLFELPVAA